MTVEASIFTALTSLVSGRVFPDTAPLTTTRPYITYQQVGGDSPTFLERALPSKKNGRFQLNVWAATRASAMTVAGQVEAALAAATSFQAEPLEAPTYEYEQDLLLYGSRQDFTIWSDR